jgi:RNA polymerase sigma-70 factor (ECF subfamily)
LSTHSDQEILNLLHRDSSGREEAFRLLLTTYRERVYWLVRRTLVIHDDADDVTQEVFIRIWKALPAFRGESSLFTWIYRIATNEVNRYLKKRRLQVFIPWNDTAERVAHCLADDRFFQGSEAERLLFKAISLLPEKQRLVFSMRYFDELSYEEISRIVGTSEGALKASYHHAMKKIEKFVAQS